MAHEHALKCAEAVRDTGYLVVRAIAMERACRPPTWLTPGAVSALEAIQEDQPVAETSELVEALLASGYVMRSGGSAEPRLSLTEEGTRAIEAENDQEIAFLARLLSARSPAECGMMMVAVDMVRSALTAGQRTCRECGRAHEGNPLTTECPECGGVLSASGP